MTHIQDSVILVVGASGGLGREIARLLATGGARVILSGRDRTKLEALGIPGTVLVADLNDPEAIRDLVAAAVSVHGRLDGIVNASGVVAFGPASALTDATLTELFAVNTLAPIRLLRASIEALTLAAEQGRDPFMLTISGVVSASPTANLAAYSASKAGLAAFGQAAARELRRVGIRIVDARPGHTETALSTHPISGTAPRFPSGHEPAAVAQRLVEAIVGGERDVPSTAFLTTGD
jgi:short-subunit dehydrogenase